VPRNASWFMSDSEQIIAYQFGEWVVEPHLNRIRRADEELQLEPRTLEVLHYLLEHPGEIVSRDELLDHVWAGQVVEPNVIDGKLNRIRQALGDSPRNPTYIETVSKRGYRTIAPVNRLAPSHSSDSNLAAALEAVTPPIPAYEGDEPYVFVCYSHDDREQVYHELTRLRGAGINVWYDEGISIGSEWTDEIANAIADCSHFLYFVSRTSVESNYCLNEVHLASDDKKLLVPVFLERTELPRSLQLTIGRFQALSKYSVPEREYARKLLATLGSYAPDEQARDWSRVYKRILAIGAIAALVAGLGFLLERGPRVGIFFDQAPENSIAVATFEDLTASHEQQWGDTIESEVRFALPKSGLLVVGARADQSATALLESADAAYVVTGNVKRSGQKIRVMVELMSTENGYQVYSNDYIRDIRDDFSAEGEIARLIASEVAQVVISGGAPTLIATKPEDGRTGALQGVLDVNQGFDEFPSFDDGEGDE
jgi:DNA-binding winged helix-turn-helix (wHTH) protein/TolB-like protein